MNMMIEDNKYEISDEIKDELSISFYCNLNLSKKSLNKLYKLYTLDYTNYYLHLIKFIYNTFNNNKVYNLNDEFISEDNVKKIASNMLYIIFNSNSKSPLFNYTTSIFKDELAFNILTHTSLIEEDLYIFLEKELQMECIILDTFNLHKDFNTIDLVLSKKGRM